MEPNSNGGGRRSPEEDNTLLRGLVESQQQQQLKTNLVTQLAPLGVPASMGKSVLYTYALQVSRDILATAMHEDGTPVNLYNPYDIPEGEEKWYWSQVGGLSTLIKKYTNQYQDVTKILRDTSPPFVSEAQTGSLSRGRGRPPMTLRINRSHLYYYDSEHVIDLREAAVSQRLHQTPKEIDAATLRDCVAQLSKINWDSMVRSFDALNQRVLKLEAQANNNKVSARDLTAPLPEETEEDDVAYYPTDKEQ